MLSDTSAYVSKLVDNLGGSEVTFSRALDIVEKALKDPSLAKGAMQAAAEALRVVLEALDGEAKKLDGEVTQDSDG